RLVETVVSDTLKRHTETGSIETKPRFRKIAPNQHHAYTSFCRFEELHGTPQAPHFAGEQVVRVDLSKAVSVRYDWKKCFHPFQSCNLVRTSSRMNGEKYGNIILDVIYPMVVVAEEAIFQEDNAPICKSKPVRELKDNLGIVTMEWQIQSPDLKMCGEIKCWIYKNRKRQTEADLEEAVFSP
ncbi:6240_t:CDS:2, partial [Ambispora gerdemannii]